MHSQSTADLRVLQTTNSSHNPVGPALPRRDQPSADRRRLTGNTARRKPGPTDQVLWDRELLGFGLRIRPNGCKSWIVHHSRRGKPVKRTLGNWPDIQAAEARRLARVILLESALDGLPVRRAQRAAAPTFTEYIEPFWRDYARHWKPNTAKRNRQAIDNDLTFAFGPMPIDAITSADVLRWRDGMADRQGSFNRAIPVLATMLGYAEQLGHRPKGSNPCKGTPRYKRQLPERYLSPAEYRRLSTVLSHSAERFPATVAIIRLLLLTGARVSEITTLRWEYVQPPRLQLPDSKTGPKTVFLNAPAAAVLAAVPPTVESPFVFPGRYIGRPFGALTREWLMIRRMAALPDVRLHDLRHSFASVAINTSVSLPIIGGLLGHALPATTMRYAHLVDHSVAEAARRVCGTVAACLRGRL